MLIDATNAPSPCALFSSLRALDYSVESSIADLVDNSISAGARNIDIEFRWNDGAPSVEIIDDGSGMAEERLISALRLAGDGPDQRRAEDDLGRFGLGLKTASIAHCRRVTVTTVHDSIVTNAGWDLDLLCAPENGDQWSMTTDPPAVVKAHRRRIGPDQGTIVRWAKFDRLLGGADPEEREDIFNQAMERVSSHLGLVFSRFLLRETEPLKIRCNSVTVQGWDPALRHLETVWTDLRHKRHDVTTVWAGDGKTTISAHVLPRQDEFPSDDLYREAGRGRWNSLQGFFVFRADRLIYDGGYLGLGFELDEHTKLARIIVDIPNSNDDEWALNVTKEALQPPPRVRAHLRTAAQDTRSKANRRYRRLGPRATTASPLEVVPVWLTPNIVNGSGSYKINRKHPLIGEMKKDLSADQWKRIKRVLLLLEQSVPLAHISQLRTNEAPEYAGKIDEKALVAFVTELASDWSSKGMALSEIKKTLLSTEPFHLFPQLIEECLRGRS